MGIFDDDWDTCCSCKKKLSEGEQFMCDACDLESKEKLAEADKAEQARKMAIRGRIWKDICPEDYRTGSISGMHPMLQTTYQGWNPLGGRSLLIVGESGAGKTTAALLFAKACHFKMVRVAFHDASDLRQAAINAATTDAGFKRFKNRFLEGMELIIIDDLGNTANTVASDEHLRSLLEGIRARGIRTIITTQYPSRKLTARFSSPEIGEAVVRRACHKADVVILPPKNLPPKNQ